MIPNILKQKHNWVGFKLTQKVDGKIAKMPINCKTGKAAKINDSTTWCSYDVAMSAMKKYKYNCIGYTFDGDGILGIDIDHCIENGVISDIVRDVLSKVKSYTELSPSGTGLHIIAKGTLPKGARKNEKIEIYDSNRFFTVTGKVFENCDYDVNDCDKSITEVYRKYLEVKAKVPNPLANKSGESSLINSNATHIETKPSKPNSVKGLTDDEILSKAKDSANGIAFAILYSGDISRYASHSEADMALCSSLAFWTAKDVTKMDRLFRASGLYREKWDKRHHANGNTYGVETLQKAIDNCSEVYKKPRKNEKSFAGNETVIFEHNSCYFKAKPNGEKKRITNFVIVPKEILDIEDESVINTKVENDRGETYKKQFALKDFANLQSFKRLLNSNLYP